MLLRRHLVGPDAGVLTKTAAADGRAGMIPFTEVDTVLEELVRRARWAALRTRVVRQREGRAQAERGQHDADDTLHDD